MKYSHHKSTLTGILAGTLLLASGCGDGGDGTNGNGDEGSYVWGSASTGSDSFVMMEAMTSTISNNTSASHSAVSTAGSVENTSLVDDGELQFASSTSDTLYAASNGTEPFDEAIEVSQVLAFVFWTVPIVAPSDSEIETMDDLVGESVAVGNAGQSSAQILTALFEEAGILDEIDVQYMDGQDSTDALTSGQISAASVSHLVGENVTPAFSELAQTMDYQPVVLEEGALNAVVDANPSLTIEATSSETLDSYTDDVLSPATTGILIVDPDVEEEVVYEATQTILENLEEAQSVAPTQLGALTPEFACENLVDFQPTHPGAQRYFEENDLCQ